MSIDFSLENVGPIEPDPSSNERIVKWSEKWWELRKDTNILRCKAHRMNGKRCKHAAMNGTSVCQTHGGRAPQVRMKAKVRIEEATDKTAKELLGMVFDRSIPEGVRLSAIKDVLDRGGLGVKSQMEIEVSAKPFERVYERIGAGPREIEPARSEPDEDDAGSLKARLAAKRSTNEYSDLED